MYIVAITLRDQNDALEFVHALVQVRIHLYTHTRTHMQTDTHTYMQLDTDTDTYTNENAHTCINTAAPVYFTCVYKHKYIPTHMRTDTHTHKCSYIQMQTHTHTHTHERIHTHASSGGIAGIVSEATWFDMIHNQAKACQTLCHKSTHYISAKEPHMSTKEPHISAKDLFTSTQIGTHTWGADPWYTTTRTPVSNNLRSISTIWVMPHDMSELPF